MQTQQPLLSPAGMWTPSTCGCQIQKRRWCPLRPEIVGKSEFQCRFLKVFPTRTQIPAPSSHLPCSGLGGDAAISSSVAATHSSSLSLSYPPLASCEAADFFPLRPLSPSCGYFFNPPLCLCMLVFLVFLLC